MLNATETPLKMEIILVYSCFYVNLSFVLILLGTNKVQVGGGDYTLKV